MTSADDIPVDEVPVSDTDELVVAGGPEADRTRRVGDYKSGNSPLSAAEIEQRKRLLTERHEHNWVPRTAENIEDMQPEEDHDPVPHPASPL